MSEALSATPKSAAVLNVDLVATVFEVLGFVCLLVAAFAVDWRFGLAAVGIMLLVVGLAAAPPSRPVPVEDGER